MQPQRESVFDQVRQYDQQRPDFPGEHVIVLGVGALLLWKAASGRSVIGRMLAGALGTVLVGRAASGTGGVARIAQLLAGNSQPR
ncbi:hypothetical protein WKW79_13295 [Variovorax robiniae]|uniref:Uncharacterized protein n=1 Tax=Variovorax robiniae TaxID=1836199 RepID=A0ABU8X785_9BURK